MYLKDAQKRIQKMLPGYELGLEDVYIMQQVRLALKLVGGWSVNLCIVLFSICADVDVRVRGAIFLLTF